MANFFAELKRRHIYRVAAAYAVVAWVLLQLVNNLAPIFELPPWIARAVVLFLVLGFPVAVLLAWVFEVTPEGLKRTATDGAPARTKHGMVDWMLTGALAVVIAIFVYQQFAPSPGARTQQAGVARLPSSSPAASPSRCCPSAIFRAMRRRNSSPTA